MGEVVRISWVHGIGRVVQSAFSVNDFGDSESEGNTPRQDFAGGDDRGQVVGARKPATEWQALMETEPGDTVPETETERRTEANRKAEMIQKVINDPNVLDDLERLVIQLGHFEGKSLRTQTEVLTAMRAAGISPTQGVAKSHLHRVHKRAMEKLEIALAPLLEEFYP